MTNGVVLLHGSGRSRFSMMRMANALSKLDYRVYNLGYPSQRLPIERLAERIGDQISKIQLGQLENLHFVTHSLGGIVLRYHLKFSQLPNLGRVVMLAPPNQGSVLADIFQKNLFYGWLIGPAGSQIGTSPDSIPKKLGSADYPVGIIAGNRSINPVFSPLIPGPDDGRISVENTKLDGMADFIVVPYIHPLIMNYQMVIQQTDHFLKQGCFQKR